MQFQVGMCFENFQRDQIKNGRLSAVMNFNMPDIWQTVQYSQTITTKQNVRFQVGISSENFQLD